MSHISDYSRMPHVVVPGESNMPVETVPDLDPFMSREWYPPGHPGPLPEEIRPRIEDLLRSRATAYGAGPDLLFGLAHQDAVRAIESLQQIRSEGGDVRQFDELVRKAHDSIAEAQRQYDQYAADLERRLQSGEAGAGWAEQADAVATLREMAYQLALVRPRYEQLSPTSAFEALPPWSPSSLHYRHTFDAALGPDLMR